ncbi:hypothetical protein F5Y16DRAFT_406509 [Xylariaceae sp. FL0255]|nr:hypothetical protein F5Y16DRAFT_406509 [Xylariaceae sp. FL0255]
MSSVPEPKFTLLQARTILYLTTQIIYEKKVKPKTAEEHRDNAIYEVFIQDIRKTNCITFTTLKGLLVALHSSETESTARYKLKPRWTLPQAYNIIHLGNQILLCQNVTKETMDWFVYAIWQDNVQSTRRVGHLKNSLVDPAIRDEFVQLLYRALYTQDQSSSDEDGSDTNTLREETSDDEGLLFGQSSLHCGDHSICETQRSSDLVFSDAAASDKENIPPSPSTAISENWDSSSTTSDDESLDGEKSSQSKGGAESKRQRDLFHNAPTRPRFEDTYQSRKRAKRLGGLIFTISAIRIKRRGGGTEALEFDSENGVWTDLDGVEYDFNSNRFIAAEVAFGVSYPSQYWWRFRSDVDRM